MDMELSVVFVSYAHVEMGKVFSWHSRGTNGRGSFAAHEGWRANLTTRMANSTLVGRSYG